MNGRRIKTHALQVIIGNTQLYGGAIKYTWQAQCDDGLLDICIVRRQSMLRRPLVLLDFLFHREQRRQWVRYEKCTQVNIRTRHPVAIQIDGDPMGYTSHGYPPTSIGIVPEALKVLVPQKTPEGLFSQPAPDA
jgi:diacylglycerol kinase family enzyme